MVERISGISFERFRHNDRARESESGSGGEVVGASGAGLHHAARRAPNRTALRATGESWPVASIIEANPSAEGNSNQIRANQV